jgi:release factor glutamine methyltransferase
VSLSAAPLIDAARQLAAAHAPALVLSEPADLPHVELLLARGHARSGERALAHAGWRWRLGGDGAGQLAGRRRYHFDGGFVLTVHHALPAGPLPAVALLPLARALWAGAVRDGREELLRPRAEPQLVYLVVQVARGVMRSPAQLAELHALAPRVADWDAVWSLARAVGVERTLEKLAESPAPAPARAGTRPTAWRAARWLRHLRRAESVADLLLGEPWRWAVTRCRFDDLELLAGPGTFLPRRVSERLVSAAAARVTSVERPLLVDVGTGCGAVALALARRHPSAQVLGLDLDAGALTWARRNALRLGSPHVDFAAGSLLDPLPASWRGRVSLVIANVPCVPPDACEGSLDAPVRAYVGGGRDGLGLQRRLAEEARDVLGPGGWLLIQLAPSQWVPYRETLDRLGFEALETLGDGVAVVGAGRRPGGR